MRAPGERSKRDARKVTVSWSSGVARLTSSPLGVTAHLRLSDLHRRIVQGLPDGIDDRAAVPPPGAGLTIDADDPARLGVADPLGDQPHEALLLFRLHPTRRRPSPDSSLAHHNLQIALVLRRSLESAPSFPQRFDGYK